MNTNQFKKEQWKNKLQKASGLFFLGLASISTISLCGCQKHQKISYLESAFAIVYEDNCPYLINSKQEKFSLENYDSIDNTFGEYLRVEKNNKFGYIKNTGEEVIQPTYDDAFLMRENKAVVRKGTTYSIISSTGETIYTFPSGMESTSYFSNQHLVISQNDQFGYLVYQEENNQVTIQKEINYSYAGVYQEGCAVVQEKKETDEASSKYFFLDEEGKPLFDQQSWDFCANFKNGYARVANYESYNIVDTRSENRVNKTITTLMYHYINKKGGYLTNSTDIIFVPYAEDFNEHMALMADLGFYQSQNLYYKKYLYLNEDGEELYQYALKVENNGFYPKVFFVGTLYTLGDTVVFKRGGNNNSFSINFTKTYTPEDDAPYTVFETMPWNIPTNTTWFESYKAKFFPNATNDSGIVKKFSSPYEMDNLSRNSICNDAIISRVRISGNNAYGIIQIKAVEKDSATSYEVSYLIDPVYSKIIY